MDQAAFSLPQHNASITTVSSLATEQENFPINTNKVELSHPEPVLPPEIKNIGVSVVPLHPPIPPEVSAAGVSATKDATPVSTTPSGIIHIPWPEEKIHEILQHDQNPLDSKLWLATLMEHELEMGKIQQKEEVAT